MSPAILFQFVIVATLACTVTPFGAWPELAEMCYTCTICSKPANAQTLKARSIVTRFKQKHPAIIVSSLTCASRIIA
jgi:hypothetical protein